MQDVSNTFVVVLGIGVVFVGLICIVLLCKIVSAVCIAAVSACVAEELGTDISAIRILSFKKI